MNARAQQGVCRFSVLGAATLVAMGVLAVPGSARAAVNIGLDDQRFDLARLAPGQTQGGASFVVDDAGEIEIDVYSTVDNLAVTVVTPGGQIIDPTSVVTRGGTFATMQTFVSDDLFVSPLDLDGFHYVYDFPTAGPGTYQVAFAAASLADEAPVVTRVATTSDLRAALFVSDTFVPLGDPLVLTAAVFSGTQPVTGASMTVDVRDPSGARFAVPLHDDGVDPDASGGDGLYSGTFTPASAGNYGAAAEMSGTDSGGLPFERQAASTFEVLRPTATLPGTIGDSGIDDDGDGLIDKVRVRADVTVTEAGAYRVVATLQTDTGQTLTRAGDANLSSGATSITADFEAAALRALGQAGPWQVADIALYRMDPDRALPAGHLQNVGQTQPYALAALQHPALMLDGTFVDQAVDDDGNGRFDRLVVSVGVDAQFAGSYTWSGALTDGNRAQIGFFSGSGALTAGANTVTLTFPGQAIGQHAVDGPYQLRGLLVFGAGQSLVADLAGQTKAYSARQFEGFPDVTPPTLSVKLSPSVLYTANHALVTITATINVSDDQDPQPSVTLLSITSSDPDSGLGYGDLPMDIQGASFGTDDRSFQLRAERQAYGPGRVYTVVYQASDASGNTSQATATVTVPKARSRY